PRAVHRPSPHVRFHARLELRIRNDVERADPHGVRPQPPRARQGRAPRRGHRRHGLDARPRPAGAPAEEALEPEARGAPPQAGAHPGGGADRLPRLHDPRPVRRGLRPRLRRPLPEPPPPGGAGRMILDLHNHTRWSFDSSMDPPKAVRVAKARGLAASAIPAHDEVEGAREARRAAGGDLLVIVGEEIDTRAGDVLGLFLQEKIATDDPLEAIRAIHDQGGIAILAHPFTKTTSVDDAVARALDGCEGFNARHSGVPSIEGTEPEPRIAAFAREYDLSLTAGSDAHFY